MRYSKYDIVLQEVPDEISLSFHILGCSLNCKNCHSSEINKLTGKELTNTLYKDLLNTYKGYVSCVLFLGGDWDLTLKDFLKGAIDNGLKTCLYTGSTDVDNNLKEYLTYLKVGPYVESLGGLNSKRTNQRFYNLKTNEDLTYKFWR